jgi:uroporphyrinogen decarboxylase
MAKLTSRERFTRMYEHKPADRIPIIDSPWQGTLLRWQEEGLGERDWVDYFDIDRVVTIGVDNSPRYPKKIIKQTDDFTTFFTQWGVTLRQQRVPDSTPEYLDFTVKTPDDWLKAKERMQPDRARVDWARLEKNYKSWREQGAWIQGKFWFGFDVTHSWFIGTERLLIALAEEPEWCQDMFNHFLDLCIAQFEMVLDAGYEFDCISWPDDMGYKQNQFFSRSMYRELLLPAQKRAIDWAHSKGIKAHLHSCGDIRPFVPDLVEAGLDALNPLEVKAGMDPYQLKKDYGSDLVLHGGINAVLWDDLAVLTEEMRRLIPVMKENGGYIFSSDHSIPNTVSLKSMTEIIRLAKELGSYD